MCLHTTLFNLGQKHDFATVISTLAAIAREQEHLRLTSNLDRDQKVISDQMTRFDNVASRLYDIAVEADDLELL